MKNDIKDIFLQDNTDTIISTINDFKIDEIYHPTNNGDIHYSVHILSDYNENKEYPLYIALPGYEGLYFQDVAKSLIRKLCF